MKLISWNINGLKAKMINNNPEFDSYVSKNWSILCFQETKLTKYRLLEYAVHKHKLWHLHFNQFWTFQTTKPGYSGVSVFSKYQPLKYNFGINSKGYRCEGRSITLEFDSYFLVNLYVPSYSNDQRFRMRVEDWDVSLREYLKELMRVKPVVVVGDMNVAHRHIDVYWDDRTRNEKGTTQEERRGFQRILDLGFVDVYRERYPHRTAFSWFNF